ncbi:S8 family serine peptidase [Massilia sp. ST3]|uniref:S8 family serine peptidase n=1 Tax=Massilia sp. ST3 TaxID=2824903 RepID=UPI001B845C38|nr:S8 family serine peptidase [Massilia sp. ST3]MBQ5946798.1 S8 family serine peptidase [Massilia sp. ST3]
MPFTSSTFRKTSLAIAAGFVSLAAISSASAAPGGVQGEFARGRILVEARAGLSDDELGKAIKAHGGKSARKLGQSNIHVVELPPGLSEEDMVAKLSRHPHFKFAELDRKVSVAMAVTDPYIGSAWHISKIGATAAWDSSQGSGITIAVLDTGVNVAHPDLKDRMVAGYNAVNSGTDVTDLCGHGTAVAGAAAATTNNALGVAGIAGAARIMPIQISYKDSTGCHAYASTIANGITWAADHGARVANVSFVGIAGSASVKSASRYMKNKGGLVFISAGNNNVDENVVPDTGYVIVSATDSYDKKASFSSWGSFVTLSAPGTSIWTTTSTLGYGTKSGTSFSSPVSAGVAGLLMAARPDLSGAQVEAIMYSTAVDLGAAGRDPIFGYGRVDAAAAMAAARGYAAPVDTTAPSVAISAPLGSSTVSSLVPVSVNASDNVGVARVELKVNGTVVATDSAAPYSFSWNSAGVANGMASLVAVAYDAAGNAGSSAAVSVNVANTTTGTVVTDTTAPVLAINNPVNGGSVSGSVAVSVSASDNAGAAGITNSIAIDGAVKATGTGGSLAYTWNSKKSGKGTHTITATSRDKAGNVATKTVSVTVR